MAPEAAVLKEQDMNAVPLIEHIKQLESVLTVEMRAGRYWGMSESGVSCPADQV